MPIDQDAANALTALFAEPDIQEVAEEDSWVSNGASRGIAADMRRVNSGEGLRKQDREQLRNNIASSSLEN